MTEIEAGPEQEEPTCGRCDDSREIWYGPGSWEQPLLLPCPECCPPSSEPAF